MPTLVKNPFFQGKSLGWLYNTILTFSSLIQYMLSGPICAMVWEGKEVVKTGRGRNLLCSPHIDNHCELTAIEVLLGATNPLASAPGTIRGDYAIVSGCKFVFIFNHMLILHRIWAAMFAMAQTPLSPHRKRFPFGSSPRSSSRISRPSMTGSTSKLCVCPWKVTISSTLCELVVTPFC